MHKFSIPNIKFFIGNVYNQISTFFKKVHPLRILWGLTRRTFWGPQKCEINQFQKTNFTAFQTHLRTYFFIYQSLQSEENSLRLSCQKNFSGFFACGQLPLLSTLHASSKALCEMCKKLENFFSIVHSEAVEYSMTIKFFF